MDCSLPGSSAHGITRVRHDLATEPPPPPKDCLWTCFSHLGPLLIGELHQFRPHWGLKSQMIHKVKQTSL